jgi:heptaprenyl diphosphate synthase
MVIPPMAEYQEDINLLNQTMFDYLHNENKLLNEAAMHLVKAGGKRIRPFFALLASKFGKCSQEKLLAIMAAIEMIHLASLIHDDVIDNAQLRRGVPTLNAKWGKEIAIATGDYILAKSLSIVSSFPDKRVLNILLRACSEIVRGEVNQFSNLYNINQSIKDYLYRIRRKTALLISASCQLGAVIAEVQPHIEKALAKYGYYLGMAFQITDDILDFTSHEHELGKPIGNDLKQGTLTLPVLYALKSKTNSNKLKGLIVNGLKDETRLEEAILIIKTSNALADSFNIAKRYIIKAKNSLLNVPDTQTKDFMLSIADLVTSRKF